MTLKEMAQRAKTLASEKNLAYVVLPLLDENDDPRIVVTGGKDRSEYEFVNLEFTKDILAAVVTQALARIDSCSRLLLNVSQTREDSMRKLLRILDKKRASLEMAGEWISDLPDGKLETGGSLLGGSWGNGIYATFSVIKKVERILADGLRIGREAAERVPQEDREQLARAIAELEEAILPEQE